MRAFRKLRPPLVLLAMAAATLACVSTTREQRTSVLEYLYPEGKQATPAEAVRLELPLDVGVAFVPEATATGGAILPAQKQALLERVRAAFLGAEGLGRIEVVPEAFLTAKGGFDNVRQLRSALGIDVIALVSYDQTQFDDPGLASITYWTIVGAYVVPGNQNETHTLVHASVFDVASEALLFNATGQSAVEGRATGVDVERALREDRSQGFELAVDDMIVQLGTALERFREQVKEGTVRGQGTPAVELGGVTSSGEPVGAGALGPLGLALGLLLLAGAAPAGRRA